MTDLDPTTAYYLRRAKEEELRAIAADDPAAAEVHHSLSVRYSAKALMLIAKGRLTPGSADDDGISHASDRGETRWSAS